jgi:hypothetical protein
MTTNRHAQLLRAFLEDTCERKNRSRPIIAWAQWARQTLGASVALGVSLALFGCSAEGDARTSSVGEGICTGANCAEECSDGIDNDADGAIDCDDLHCAVDRACAASSTGGGSSSGGSTAAGADAGTVGTGGKPATGSGGAASIIVMYGAPMEDCGDGVDNDGDTLVDCDDEDCFASGLCAGMTDYAAPMDYEYDCADQLDNDGDGLIDCDDADCAQDSACMGDRYGIPF